MLTFNVLVNVRNFLLTCNMCRFWRVAWDHILWKTVALTRWIRLRVAMAFQSRSRCLSLRENLHVSYILSLLSPGNACNKMHALTCLAVKNYAFGCLNLGTTYFDCVVSKFPPFFHFSKGNKSTLLLEIFTEKSSNKKK